MDSLIRCPWCLKDEMYMKYHDEEWGVPVFDDRKQFEFLLLEAAQAGLSWHTILSRRENYRKAYLDFDFEKIANFSEHDIERLLKGSGIIRNKMKIKASVNNARKFIEVQKEYGSFSKYIWSFTKGKSIVNGWVSILEIPAKTELSERISRNLKSRGFQFLGPTIVYSHLQAVGVVNDHLKSCFRLKEIKETQTRLPFKQH
jgi:DNA-3-methyladenine glycosylase I